MGNSPAFQYYPADFISDPEVMFWDMESIGCYWQMINYLWINEGKCEENIEIFCKLFRKNHKKTSEKLWKKIEKKFIIKDGIITHKRVTKEINKQLKRRLELQAAGKKGAEKRWKSDSQAINEPLAKNSPSSSSSSSSSSLKDKKTPPTPQGDVIYYPGWLDLDLWKEFKKHKTALKKKMTPQAEKLNIKKLKKIIDEGFSQKEIIENVIEKGWIGMYKPKKNTDKPIFNKQGWDVSYDPFEGCSN